MSSSVNSTTLMASISSGAGVASILYNTQHSCSCEYNNASSSRLSLSSFRSFSIFIVSSVFFISLMVINSEGLIIRIKTANSDESYSNTIILPVQIPRLLQDPQNVPRVLNRPFGFKANGKLIVDLELSSKPKDSAMGSAKAFVGPATPVLAAAPASPTVEPNPISASKRVLKYETFSIFNFLSFYFSKYLNQCNFLSRILIGIKVFFSGVFAALNLLFKGVYLMLVNGGGGSASLALHNSRYLKLRGDPCSSSSSSRSCSSCVSARGGAAAFGSSALTSLLGGLRVSLLGSSSSSSSEEEQDERNSDGLEDRERLGGSRSSSQPRDSAGAAVSNNTRSRSTSSRSSKRSIRRSSRRSDENEKDYSSISRDAAAADEDEDEDNSNEDNGEDYRLEEEAKEVSLLDDDSFEVSNDFSNYVIDNDNFTKSKGKAATDAVASAAAAASVESPSNPVNDTYILMLTETQWNDLVLRLSSSSSYILSRGGDKVFNSYYIKSILRVPVVANRLKFLFVLPYEDNYRIAILNAASNPLQFEGTIELINPGGNHMSTTDRMQSEAVMAMCFLYGLTSVGLFVILLSLWRNSRSDIHVLMTISLAIKSVYLSLDWNNVEIFTANGELENYSWILPRIVSKFYDIILLLVFLLLSLGWKVHRIRLSLFETRALVTVCVVLFYLGMFQFSMFAFEAIRYIILCLAYIVVLVAVNVNIAILEQRVSEMGLQRGTAEHYYKIEAYQVFRIAFIIFVFKPTILLFYKLFVLYDRDDEDWILVIIDNVFDWSIMLVLVYAFRPAVNFRLFKDLRIAETEEATGFRVGAAGATGAAGPGGAGPGGAVDVFPVVYDVQVDATAGIASTVVNGSS